MNRAVYHGHPAVLLLGAGMPRVLYADERGAPAPVPAEPLYAGSPIADDAALFLLEHGTVSSAGTRASGTLGVLVEREGRRIPAVFIEAPEEAIKKELAAYRIDRALRLGLVPATVAREVGGKRGILQARPPRWVTQAEVEARSLRAEGLCPLPPQFELMYAFDALIGNEGRTSDRLLYDGEWTLLLTGHDRAFGPSRALPAHLRPRPPRPGPELRRRLSALDAAALSRIAGDLLTERERAALLARRDALLGEKPSSAAER